MAILPIRLYPDPVLREPATPVTDFDDSVRKLITDMAETMRAAPGVGLAAPQVGVQRRVLVYSLGEDELLRALVNPEITQRTGEMVGEEGCLSIPGLAYGVKRAQRIAVKGLDADGQPVAYEAEELEARVIQHEVDHLDGILFLDRLDREDRREAMRQLRESALHPTPIARPAPAPTM